MLYFLGFIMLIIGTVMMLPIPVAFLFDETYLIPNFLIPAAIAFAVGLFLRGRFKPTEISLGKAMVMVVVVWIVFAGLGSIPYIFGSHISVEDAYFEGMAGFTATGLTMFPGIEGGIEGARCTILFWRSLTQWVGGLGVIVLFLAALIGFGRAARKMYVAEARVERIEPSIRKTARSLWKIYVLLTILGIVGFCLAGLPNLSPFEAVFEAVNHSMTGIATGGFSVRGDSFERYGAPVLGVAIMMMMMGAISFAVHRRVMGGNWRELLRNVEVRLMLALIVLATLLLFWSVGVKDALFQSTSALTGTGFSTAPLSGGNWEDPQKGLLVILMVTGGGYGSTSSAIKLIRMVIIVKAIHWMIKRSFLPERAVVPMKISNKLYREHEVMETAIYALIYVIVLIGGAVVLMLLGYSAMNSIFESASAQGNVGLSVGITSTTMHLAGKISLMIQMLVGRLEIIPVIAFLGYLISKVPRPHPKPF